MPKSDSKAPELKFKFIKDEPASSENGGVFEFYHTSIAPALARMLEDSSAPHTVGLFGAWGSGKSTIIDMLDKGKTLKAPVFIFDAWKYQHENALRRIFLKKLVEFINDHPDLNCAISLEELDRQLYRQRSHAVASQVPAADTPSSWPRRALKHIIRNWLFAIVSVAVVGWVLLQIFVKKNIYLQGVRDVAKTVAGYSVVLLILKGMWDKVVTKAIDDLTTQATIVAELHTITEFEARIDSPEQFEALFDKIITHIGKPLVIVFDNIDRVQGDIAISMLSTIKTFLDPTGKSGLVVIIPTDANAIESQIMKFYASNSGGDGFDASEYLRKIFNLVIWAPEFIGTDLEDYTTKKLKETGEIKSLLGEDVALVINAAFSRNPREIIQFINNLIAAILVASETEVWPAIEQKIPYLAKVLVLKQKFPAAYQRLRDRWYEPESVVDLQSPDDKPNDQLVQFMNLTDRITTEDAEPFIYFKSPVRSSKLKHSDELRRALTAGAVDDVKELIAKEKDNEQVAQFVCDLLDKYKSQQKPLINIFTSHAAAFAEQNISVSLPRYYQTTLRVVDQQLWQAHEELSVSYTLGLADNSITPKKLRTTIFDRYIAVLGSNEVASDYAKAIFEQFTASLEKLTVSQKTRIKELVSSKYLATNEILEQFQDRKVQDAFVGPEAMRQFISNITDTNMAGFVGTLKSYKEYLKEHSLTESLFTKIAETLIAVNASRPGELAPKSTIFEALRTLCSLYQKDDLKSRIGGAADLLADALLASYPQIPAANDRGSLVTTMYWTRNCFSPNLGASILAQIRDYYATADISSIAPNIEYWGETTQQRLIEENLPSFLPRLARGDLLAFVYDHAATADKLRILEHLATMPGNVDVNFISTLRSYPERSAVMRILISKVATLPYNLSEPYYDFLTSKLTSRDQVELRDAIILQAKGLLRTDDAQSQKVGYELVSRLKTLNETNRRDIGRDLLDWLKEPGRAVSRNHEFALKVLTLIFPALQDPPQAEIVYLAFNLLGDAPDVPTAEVALRALQAIKPKYLKYSKDFEDAAVKLAALPDGDARAGVIRAGLAALQSERAGAKEKAYFNGIQNSKTKANV